MRLTTANKFVFFFAFLGLALSSYLSWYTLWGPGCASAAVSCSGGNQPVLLFGLPSCVYGFPLFLAMVVLSILVSRSRLSVLRGVLGLAVVGTGFSGGLTVYELWFQGTETATLPACAYGFLFFLAALVFSAVGVRKLNEAI